MDLNNMELTVGDENHLRLLPELKRGAILWSLFVKLDKAMKLANHPHLMLDCQQKNVEIAACIPVHSPARKTSSMQEKMSVLTAQEFEKFMGTLLLTSAFNTSVSTAREITTAISGDQMMCFEWFVQVFLALRGVWQS